MKKKLYVVWIRRNNNKNSWCIQGAVSEGAIETCISAYHKDDSE